MQDRTVVHRLREEYFDRFSEIERVLAQLEAEIRYHTLPILHDLREPEKLVYKTRIKACESAIGTLLRRKGTNTPEGRRFDPDRIEEYSLLTLPDLAGVRVLVFPSRKLNQADALLQPHFSDWTAKPVKNDKGEVLAPKYHGYCAQASSRIQGEYQIVPMLLGLFWEVEHSAMYKFRAVANSKEMRERRASVEKALAEFEEGVERFL
jgi:ppGpp synthetase/RelA/SpoT-type nucleotidyltranferase